MCVCVHAHTLICTNAILAKYKIMIPHTFDIVTDLKTLGSSDLHPFFLVTGATCQSYFYF